MSNEPFFPEGYAPPVSKSRYTSFDIGETKLRILSSAIAGVEFWVEDGSKSKPVRFKTGEQPKDQEYIKKTFKPNRNGSYGKNFVAFTVFNYRTEQIEVCELTQASIIRPLFDLARDEDWGNPIGYDIKINKSGTGVDTSYALSPVPHKPVPVEIQDAYMDTPVKLEALFTGEDPFDCQGQDSSDDLPF